MYNKNLNSIFGFILLFKILSINAFQKIFDNEEYGIGNFNAFYKNGLEYELIKHESFESHSIRLRKPKLCDNTVNSYSGYLDIDKGLHLFFWAFESRNDPLTDPVVLWLNGGPGCSSTTGLLFENGPCTIEKDGKNVTRNDHSWNNKATVIYLDQPVQVGYSYGDKTVSTSQESAVDVYAFMRLFYHKFPEFAKNEFHIAGESYAGTYIPNIAEYVIKSNVENDFKIPLKSLLIGNGLTDAYTQFPAIADYSCDSHFAYLNKETCRSMRKKVPFCQRLTKACYDNPNRFTCVAATISCWQVSSPIQSTGKNPYDVRKNCNKETNGDLCYKELVWVAEYLNREDIKKELGADDEITFESCNMNVNKAFQFNGDVSHNTAALVPKILSSGVRVLLYVGENDIICNYIGNLKWATELEWEHGKEFSKAPMRTYRTGGKKPETAGYIKSIGNGSKDKLVFLRLHNAGHMVPADIPEVSLDMFNRWIENRALIVEKK